MESNRILIRPRSFDSGTLAFEIDSLDGISDALKPLYVADGDKFKLKISGLPEPKNQADVSGLKSALEKEREAARKSAKELAKWKRLGLSQDEIQAVLDKDKKAAEDTARESGDYEALMAQAKEKWDKERDDLLARAETAEAHEREAVVNSQLTGSLAKAGFTEEGLALIPQMLAPRVKIETIDGQRVTTIMTEDMAAPMIGEAGTDRATFAELAKATAVKFPSLVKSDMNGGGGKPSGSGGNGGGKQMLRSEFNKLHPLEQSATVAGGTTIVD